MKFSHFRQAVRRAVNALEEKIGDSFLEIMVDTIEIRDRSGGLVHALYGIEYNLSRSRHWDKEQEHYIFFDGFDDEHLNKLYDDVMDLEPAAAEIIMNIEGMNDLDEPIHDKIKVEMNSIHE